ncbi:2OG-Fe(II) oxygenase [Stenotrophomonas ginsengisoli]|uniref:2OG-Fe(II) oxygenase n=1 Tax=Stenotrophomonas ginsengisoli TaxID=336566 RepID=A0A0R0DAA3_9GAMM|nr:2OG-Fe(II) oxygenase [Stenotrophomonas ginsengisoli]KRG79293.1 2OG-Fe(II) oxygenase [Stenotrophomonas ginsengisoli]
MSDFIEVIDNAVDPATCAAIVAQMQQSQGLRPGEVGGGVFPELKHSRDLRLAGQPEWAQANAVIQQAVFAGLQAYLRTYPQALISPLMLQVPVDGGSRRLGAEDVTGMDDQALGQLAQTCFRPGAVNLQWYRANEGGYPYWHCELYPRDAQAETLHRHLLWTLYLNDDFAEGETEFLYQQRKIAPRTGSLLIAPTAFTHTHRGNRPRDGDKFIATSWILFQRAESLYVG